jgi:hypothetical protein
MVLIIYENIWLIYSEVLEKFTVLHYASLYIYTRGYFPNGGRGRWVKMESENSYKLIYHIPSSNLWLLGSYVTYDIIVIIGKFRANRALLIIRSEISLNLNSYLFT